jgi:phage terminase small subunit
MLIAGRKDAVVRNPAFQLWRDHAMLTLAAASRFGLSPSDRASLPALKDGDSVDELFAK